MKNILCPLCGSHNNSIIYNINDFSVVQCKNCHHIYTFIDNDININRLYEERDYQNFDSRGTLFEKIIDYENSRILKKIEKIVSKGKLLDFGAGKGKFLNIAKKNGWKCVGIETATNRALYAKNNYQLKIITKKIHCWSNRTSSI